MMKRYIVIGILVILGGFAVYGFMVRPGTESSEDIKPNEYESAYSILAPENKAPFLCEKIRPTVRESYAFNSPGLQTLYTRSECFYRVALATGDPKYCAGVIEKKSFVLDGTHYTRENCEMSVANKEPFLTTNFDDKLILNALGLQSEVEKLRQYNAQQQQEGLTGVFGEASKKRCADELTVCLASTTYCQEYRDRLQTAYNKYQTMSPEEQSKSYSRTLTPESINKSYETCLSQRPQKCDDEHTRCLYGSVGSYQDPANLPYYEYYFSVQGTPDFIKKLMTLPDFNSSN